MGFGLMHGGDWVSSCEVSGDSGEGVQPGDGLRVLPEQEGGDVRRVQSVLDVVIPGHFRGEDDCFQDELDVLVDRGVGDPEVEAGSDPVEYSLGGGRGMEVESDVL